MSSPEVLHWLKALGFTYTRLAEALGITQPMLSLWLNGKRPVPAHHYRDLVRLYLRAEELARAGKDPQEAFATWQPLSLVTETPRGEVFAVSQTGRIPIPPDIAALLMMLADQRQRGDISTETSSMLQDQLLLVAGLRTLQKLTPTDPWDMPLDADAIDLLLATLAGLTLTTLELASARARERAQTPHPPTQKEASSAD